MAKKELPKIRQFVNGRIGRVSNFLLPEGAVTTAKNVHFDELGQVKLRDGTTLINTSLLKGFKLSIISSIFRRD